MTLAHVLTIINKKLKTKKLKTKKLKTKKPKNFELLDWFSLAWIFRSDCFGVFYVSDELALGADHPVGVLPDWLGAVLCECLLVVGLCGLGCSPFG